MSTQGIQAWVKAGISKSGPRPHRTTGGVILIFGMLTGGLQLGVCVTNPFWAVLIRLCPEYFEGIEIGCRSFDNPPYSPFIPKPKP